MGDENGWPFGKNRHAWQTTYEKGKTMNEIDIQELTDIAKRELLDSELCDLSDRWHWCGLSWEQIAPAFIWRACVDVGLEEVVDIVATLQAEADADEEIDEDQDDEQKPDE
jgi:hypothetical protein